MFLQKNSNTHSFGKTEEMLMWSDTFAVVVSLV